jgi:inner membrane protein
MPSAFTHAMVGAAAAQLLPDGVPKGRLGLVFAVAATVPDLDVVGFGFGIPYGSIFGHRGFSHSLLFAAALATMLWLLARRWTDDRAAKRLLSLWLVAFVAVALHGVLDAATDAGRGIGFFIPFDNHRYFLPFRPIETSSLNPARFFGARGLHVLSSEILWVWLPVTVLSAGYQVARRWRRPAVPA